MAEKLTAIIIDGKKYEFREGKYSNAMEACADCALHEKCNVIDDDTLCHPLGVQDEMTSNFQLADEDCELTEEKVYDFYQERSVTAGSRADQLAWMFVVMMTGVLISGHVYQTFSVCAALSAIYMLLSVMQAVWQTFTSLLFMRQIRKTAVKPSDYPSWVGCGAWLFFWLKMISTSAAVFYFVHAIFS
jgi:hypothetical protein